MDFGTSQVPQPSRSSCLHQAIHAKRAGESGVTSREIGTGHATDENPAHYEEDHFTTLELGGPPAGSCQCSGTHRYVFSIDCPWVLAPTFSTATRAASHACCVAYASEELTAPGHQEPNENPDHRDTRRCCLPRVIASRCLLIPVPPLVSVL